MKRLIPLIAVLVTPVILPSQLARAADVDAAPVADAAPVVLDAASVVADAAPVVSPPIAPDPRAPRATVTSKSTAEGKQSPAEELFASKCASCHSVGKGDRVGPDLKDAHQRRERAWLLKMVQSPNSMLDSDAVARALLKQYKNVRMPDLAITNEQAVALVELVERCSAEPCNLAGVFVPVTKATATDVEDGRRMFVGLTALENDGPPCVACHSVRGTKSYVAGGTLAKDLGHVFARLGDEGLDTALRNPSFPLMKDIFSKHALSKEEAFSLRAFFSASNRSEETGSDTYSVLLVSFVGTLVCLIVLNALWSRRLRAVRKPLTQKKGVAS